MELSYAVKENLNVALVKNTAGQYVKPSFESVTAAASALLAIPPDLCFSLINAPGEQSYPVCGTTWAVLYQNLSAAGAKGKELVKFLRWAVHDGQAYLRDLRFAPLPTPLVARIDEKLGVIQTS